MLVTVVEFVHTDVAAVTHAMQNHVAGVIVATEAAAIVATMAMATHIGVDVVTDVAAAAAADMATTHEAIMDMDIIHTADIGVAGAGAGNYKQSQFKKTRKRFSSGFFIA